MVELVYGEPTTYKEDTRYPPKIIHFFSQCRNGIYVDVHSDNSGIFQLQKRGNKTPA